MPANNPWNWNLTAVRAIEAMDVVWDAIGEDGDWGTVTIAHLDTGYTEHPTFAADVRHLPPSLRPAAGMNLVEDGTPPLDPINYSPKIMRGHGTRTAGVLCGNHVDAAGQAILVGLAPSVPVIPYRITNSVVLSARTITNAAEALDHAVNQRNAGVVSISLGIQSVAETGAIRTAMRKLGAAIDDAYQRGVIVVGAGGQTGDAPELFGFVVYPAAYSRTIGAGGTNFRNRICYDYEIHADSIDVWAPADEIVRPNVELTPAGPDYYIDKAGGDGTSYATVHVAAAAAMWLRVRGADLDAAGFTDWQRVEAFRSLLKSTAQPLAGNDVRPRMPTNGSGLLDCLALLNAPLPGLTPADERQQRAADEH